MQRMAVAERFDMTHLAEYHAFLRDSATAFLVKHDAWLKRREIKHPTRAHDKSAMWASASLGLKLAE